MDTGRRARGAPRREPVRHALAQRARAAARGEGGALYPEGKGVGEAQREVEQERLAQPAQPPRTRRARERGWGVRPVPPRPPENELRGQAV